MAAAVLALAFVLTSCLQAPPDPSALVAQLESSRPNERDEATRTLRLMAAAALPALDNAAKTAAAPEARDHAAALRDDIRRDLLVKPSMVQLDAKGLPPREAAQALTEQSGNPIEFSNLSGTEQPIHFRDASPRRFWEAFDQLAESAGLTFQMSTASPDKGGGPLLQIYPNPLQDRPPVAYSGPFRMALQSLHVHRDHDLIRGLWLASDRYIPRPPLPKVPGAISEGQTITSVYGDLQVLVEPRMTFLQNGPARVIEAIDDRGQSFLPPEPLPTGLHGSTNSYSGGQYASSSARIPLGLPAQPGRSLARLRGTIPVLIYGRPPEPALTIPLDQAAGRTFTVDDVVLEVRQVEVNESGTRIALGAHLLLDRPDIPDRMGIASRLTGFVQQQVAIRSAKGRVTPSSSGGGASPDNTSSWNCFIGPNNEAGPPQALLIFGSLAVRSEIAFEFTNIPLP